MGILGEGSLFMRFLNRLADLLILNLLTLVMCLPVVTAGASITAMHYILLKMVRGEEGYIVKPFFSSFKRNFRQATILWVMFMVLSAILVTCFLLVARGSGAYPAWLQVSILITGVILLVVMFYTFALLARYDNTVLQTLFNGFALTFGQPLRSLEILIVLMVPLFVGLRTLLPLFILFGLSVPGYACAMIYDPVFRRIEKQMGIPEEEPEETEDA